MSLGVLLLDYVDYGKSLTNNKYRLVMNLSPEGNQEREFKLFWVISCLVFLITFSARSGSCLFFKYDTVFEKIERANKGAI